VHQQQITGPLVKALGQAAAEAGVWLHGGSFSERHESGNSNTSVVFNPAGELVATYRKIHLFGFDRGEAVTMSAGDEFVLVPNTPLGTIGLATCYDLRFPELFRELTAMGAQTLLLTSGWPTPRIAHWDILTSARAIENQAWLIACNEVGEHGGVTLGGHSCVVDPMGNTLVRAGGTPEVLYCDIDVAVADEWRESFPALKDRRI
jgi:predicted amidohydrolase